MDHVHFAHSPVHGIGVFASEDIEPGTKIMEEIALWVIDKLTFLRGTFPTSLDAKDLHIMRGIMIESFKRSNPFEEGSVQKKEYEGKILGLYGRPVQGDEMSGDPAELQKVLSMRVREIIIQNAVHEPGDGQPEWNAVFEGASRVNHSCVPNAELVLAEGAGGSRVCYSINVITHLPDYVTDRYQWSTITTTTSIKKGEEIFLNYLDPLTLSAARQKKLKSRWGFTCACKLCVSPQREVAASDERHAAIATTLKLIMACEATQSGGFVVGDLGWKRVDALAQEEGVNDMTLFKVMAITANAARRTKKVSMEMGLVRRMLAVSTTFGGSSQYQQSLRDRLEYLQQKATEVAAMVAACLAGRQCGWREPAGMRGVTVGPAYRWEFLVFLVDSSPFQYNRSCRQSG